MNHTKSDQLDKIDRNILRVLQKNSRISNIELAKEVGLSPTPCLKRTKRLENIGCIRDYTIKINPAFVDASLLVFVEIRLERTSRHVFGDFRQQVQKLPEIMECHLVSGDFDYLLKARVSDMNAYRKLLGETLLSLPHVNSTRSYMVMEEVKESGLFNIIEPEKARQ